MRTSSILFCLLMCAVGVVYGQEYISDTTFVADARKSTVKLYTSRLGVVSNVYNGNEYQEYRPQEDEHPYVTQDWIYGAVDYAGEHYESVPLLYDLSTDQLITVYSNGNSIQMIHEKVRSFQLGERTFVRLDNDQVSPGFYERLYNGKVKFYVKRKKTLYVRSAGTITQNYVTTTKMQKSFEPTSTYYLVKDGVFRSFKTRGAVLKVLGDHKAELKKFIREQRIPFGADREKSTVRVLAYYDQITQ